MSKKNKYNNALIEKASQEIRETRSATQAESTIAKSRSGEKSGDYQNLQSAFLLGKRDGDTMSTGSKFRDNVDPDTLSEKKSTIAQSVAARSYLSNRLSRG